MLDANKAQAVELRLLAQTGQYVAGLMRQRISAGISPALSPRYLKRKLARYPGATTPLIASGQLWASIGAQVEGSAVAQAAARASARKAAKKALARRRAVARANRIARKLAKITRAGKRGVVKAFAKVTRAARRARKAGRARKAATRYLTNARKREVRRATMLLRAAQRANR